MTRSHQITELLSPELRAELRRLHFSTRRLVTFDLVGSYRSAFRGHGIEFEEVREYAPGDEIRRIDWKVTARRGTPYIKTYREERELSVLLALDISGSMFTGSRQQLRSRLMAQVSALLALIATRNNDRIGLLTFSDKIEQFHPPARGRKPLTRILGDILLPLASGSRSNELTSHQTSLTAVSEFILRTVRRHTIIFVISDFFSNGYQDAFAKLAHNHELVTIRCLDKLDFSLPDADLVYIRNPESGAVTLINSSSARERSVYAQQIADSREQLKLVAQKYGFRSFELFTDEPFMPVLRRFFTSDVKQKLSV